MNTTIKLSLAIVLTLALPAWGVSPISRGNNGSDLINLPALTYENAPNGAIFFSPTVSVDLTAAANTLTTIFTVPTGKNFVCMGGVFRFTAVGATVSGTARIADSVNSSLSNAFSGSTAAVVGTVVTPTGITSASGGSHVVTAGNTVNAMVTTQATGGAQTVFAYCWGFYY